MTLALAILNPALLWAGTAMASIPVIIHLLNRLRFKRVVWAAMEFLLAAHRKNARRVRIEQLILLIIRTAIILLLAAALARPVLEGLLASLGRSATHRVLVVDDSYSMASGGGTSIESDTLMKEARKTAEYLAQSFDKRDGVSLVLAGSKQNGQHARIGPPSYNHEQVMAEIEKLQPSDSATDMTGAVEEVKKILDESRELEKKIVYIITDSTRSTWLDREGQSLRTLMAGLAERGSVVVVDMARTDRPNLAIRDLRPERPVVTTEILTGFELEVENMGDQPASDIMVKMTVDGQSVPPVVIGTVEPGKTVARKWAYRFDREGDHTVSATISDTPLDAAPADSRRYAAVSVQDVVHVLLVDGDPKPQHFQSETAYLAEALDPRGRDDERATEYGVTAVRDTDLSVNSLDGQDLVVLANVASVGDQPLRALERFVEDGGSLLVFLGGQVRLQDYNQSLYAGGKGLLPASLVGTLGTTEKGQDDKYTTFDVRHFEHPALTVFKAKDGAGLNRVQVYKRFQLKLPAEEGASSVVLWFEDGHPAIVEKRYGRGRVMLVATTADAEWSALPKLPTYVPLVHELMKYMLPDVAWRYNRMVDTDTEIPMSAGQARQTFDLKKPRGGSVTLSPEQSKDRFVLSLKGLNEAGLYSLKGSGLDRWLAVNVDTREGDLHHVSKDELATRLGQVPIVYAEGQAGLVAALSEQQSAGGWARNLLFAMLALVLAETLLAWLFNRGV